MGESKARALLRAALVAGGVEGQAPDAGTLAALTATAREQRTGGVLLAALERERPAWAGALVPQLQRDRRERLARTLQQIALAARAMAVLEQAGVRSLPLKGVALAETVYDLESDRPMGDVDLLALEAWDAAAQALRAEGFDEVERADHARVLVERGSGALLELHRSVTSAPGLFPLDVEGLWARRRAGAKQLPVLPSPEDLLLQLALHAAFQHGLVLTLLQWLDFRRVLEREPIDVGRLLALASAARATAPLAAALLAAEAVVAAPLPPPLRVPLEAALAAGLRRALAPRLADPLAFVTPARADVAGLRWQLLAGRRAELVWRTLVLPEDASGATRLAPRLVQAARRAARLGGGAVASLTGLRRRD